MNNFNWEKLKSVREQLKLSQSEAASMSGMLQKDISMLEKGKKSFIPIMYIQFLTKMGVDINSIFNQAEDALLKIDGNEKLNYDKSHHEKIISIPLIPLDAIAGIGSGEFSISENDIEHRYVVPEFEKAEFLIRVKGSSMYPKYNAGDILACKRIPMSQFIQWNKTYVLDTIQGIMVKRIIKGSDQNHWILRSDNKDYQDIDVKPDSDIHGISLVIGVIRLE